MDKEQLRMQMLSGIITESEYKVKLAEIEAKEKESLNEHYVAGGIVGLGAINQIPPREKADYENAFEHFLNQKYDLKENEDDMPEAPSHEETDANQVYEEEVEDAFSSPKDTNPVVQGYLKQLTDMLNTQTDDMFDLKNLKYAIDKFSNMVNDEIAKFEVEEGKEKKSIENLREWTDNAGVPNPSDKLEWLEDQLTKLYRMGKLDAPVDPKDLKDLAKIFLDRMFGDLEEGKEVEEKSNY
jgi:hypothetical protein